MASLNYLELTLQDINREFVALNLEEKRRNNVVLSGVLDVLLNGMRKNKLFDRLFRTVYFGGSYYDDLKVSKPNEYDLDILFDLPLYARPVISITDMPGYLKVELENIKNFEKTQESRDYPLLAQKLLNDNNQLSTSKVLKWMESVVNKALPGQIEDSDRNFDLKLRKQGPAFTLTITGTFKGENVRMDVDLVPCFVFRNEKLPEYPYRQNDWYSLADEFFVVPKKPKLTQADCEQYWRLSCQVQESQLIHDKGKLKPALRLLKRLRDACGHDTIVSYYIKTIFLWKVLKTDEDFWHKNSLSLVFMTLLKEYQKFLEEGDIPYFWNKDNNLLCYLHRDNVINIANHLKRVIRCIEENRDNPRLIVNYFDVLKPPSMEQTSSQEESTCTIL